jgi:hypothetical protein
MGLRIPSTHSEVEVHGHCLRRYRSREETCAPAATRGRGFWPPCVAGRGLSGQARVVVQRPDACDERAGGRLADCWRGELEQLAFEVGIAEAQFGIALRVGLQVDQASSVAGTTSTRAPRRPGKATSTAVSSALAMRPTNARVAASFNRAGSKAASRTPPCTSAATTMQCSDVQKRKPRKHRVCGAFVGPCEIA